jgi:hypothetical protein
MSKLEKNFEGIFVNQNCLICLAKCIKLPYYLFQQDAAFLAKLTKFLYLCSTFLPVQGGFESIYGNLLFQLLNFVDLFPQSIHIDSINEVFFFVFLVDFLLLLVDQSKQFLVNGAVVCVAIFYKGFIVEKVDKIGEIVGEGQRSDVSFVFVAIFKKELEMLHLEDLLGLG